MGAYTIVIEGSGAHHNQDNPGDAEKLMQKFVKELEANHHAVSHASFTQSGRETLEKIGGSRRLMPG